MGGRGERKKEGNYSQKIKKKWSEGMHGSRAGGNERFQQVRGGSKVRADWIRGGIGGRCDAASNRLIFCWSDFDFDPPEGDEGTWQDVPQAWA